MWAGFRVAWRANTFPLTGAPVKDTVTFIATVFATRRGPINMARMKPLRHGETVAAGLVRRRAPVHAEKGDVGFRYRSAFQLLTACNGKTPKGEAAGYFSAILYLLPHTSGGAKTLCPFSTPDCREMCLSASGLSGLPRAMAAKRRRTVMFNHDRQHFLTLLAKDIERLAHIAAKEGMKPALRLNGTSDVAWEAIIPGWANLPVQRYDYTKWPLHQRKTDPAYHLTFSIEGPQDMDRALRYLADGHSVAAVVPEELKARALRAGRALLGIGRLSFNIIDGDESDLRFLDPPGSLVLLKPKGHIRTGLMRPNLFLELRAAAEAVA